MSSGEHPRAAGTAPDPGRQAGTVAPCAGTPTTRWPVGPSSVTFAAGPSPGSTCATRTRSCCGRPATSATPPRTTVRSARPGTCATSPTSTARTSGRPTGGASSTRASSNGSAPRTTSSPATSSRSAPTAGGTSSPGASCTDAGTRGRLGPPRQGRRSSTVGATELVSSMPPGAVGALDGGGSEMAAESSLVPGRAPLPRALAVPDVAARKGGGTPLVMVTAYDAPSAARRRRRRAST